METGSCGLLTLGPGIVSDSFTDFWNPIPHTGSPCPALIQSKMFNPTIT